MATHPRIARAFALLALACPVLSAQEYSFRFFGVAEGLTNLAVRQIYQDRAGFVWVSTENGIFRYDGDRFEPFGLAQGMPANSGVALGDAPDGSLLVGTKAGLYHLTSNHFEKLPLPATEVSWAQGIQSDGKGRTFIGTDAGLVQLSATSGGGQFKVQLFPQASGTSGPQAGGVAVDGEKVWYGCGLELCRMDANGTTVLGRDSGLPNNVWLVIRRDGEGNLWVRGQNSTVFVLPRGKTKFRRADSEAPSGALVGIPALDADGRIMLPSTDGLLIRGETGWKKIGRSAGLRGTVYSVFEDRQHSLWIGLAGRGLARLRGYGEWETYTTESGLGSDTVYEILPLKDGSVWLGTEGGLFRGVRREAGIAWKKVPAAGDFAVHAVQLAPGGDIYIGTETHGAARIDAATGNVEWFGQKEGLTGKAAYVLRFDREQRLWVATEAGVFVAKAPYRSFSQVAELPSTRFWAIAEAADGTVWAGGASGLFAWASGHWQNYTRADGLANDEVISLGAGPDGKMWVGYRFGGGIDRVSRTPRRIVIDKAVQRRGTDGLVYFLELDSAGRLWAGTERGVDMWDGSHWTHYDTTDGLAWDDCNLNAFAAEADGTVWIGTSGGLSRFRPRPSPTAPLAARVVFTKLHMGPLDVYGRSNPSVDPSVSAHSNTLSARYSVLNALRENDVIFRYRLMPANSTWTETTQRELEFAGLAPAAYRLEVEARDGDGKWSIQRGEFAFEILTPWYRTWWFLGTGALIPLLIVAGALRLRMLGAKRRENELVRMVEARTLDLKQANEDLLRLSSLDPLTGLANRRIFDQTLERECSRLNRSDSAVSLVILDIDCFKALNDSEGHQRGDEYLWRVGTELSRLVRRQVDVAARYGGEEFALILPDTNAPGAARFAESVRLAIANLALPHLASSVAPVVTVSVGVATATSECRARPAELLTAADHALYQAKRNGRNRVETADAAPVSEEYALETASQARS